MSRPLEFHARPVADLAELARGEQVIDVTVTPAGEVLLLTLDGAADYRSADGCFPKERADRDNRYTVVRAIDDLVIRTPLRPTRDNFGYVRDLGDGELLLVRGRAREEPNNAAVYSEAGDRLRAFPIGDAVEHVAAFAGGAGGPIWVSRFDEGWEEPTPLGRHGLVAFDRAGEVLYRHAENFMDCYAMNAAGPADMWIYTYMDFPLVRVRDGRIVERHPPCPIKGAKAFAVRGREVLFRGAYERPAALALLDLESGRVRPAALAGRTPGRVREAFGQGTKLYLATDEALLCVDLNDRG